MLKFLDAQYATFNASERLNLAISALAKNDCQEVARLWRTAPIKNYQARDLFYKEKFTAFTLVSIRFSELCTSLCQKIALSTVTSLLFSLNQEVPFIKEMNPEQMAQKENNAIDTNIKKLKSVFIALEEFCIEVGLDSDDLIKSTGIEERCMGLQEYLSFDFEPDIEFTGTVKKEFLSFWRK